MAYRLTWLSSCKSTQLKTLATAIGINSSGIKAALISDLQHHLPRSILAPNDSSTSPKKARKACNIISIDMGIRNLAYCRLHLPSAKAESNNAVLKPTISDWARVAVSAKTAAAQDPDDESAKAQIKEAFDPATYSAHAYKLLSHLLFRSAAEGPPTQILIERQRFRSMGGSAVQEWTLRVNMFEAMLYAVLKTLQERGVWGGSVHAVAPGKVAKFWLGGKKDEVEGLGGKSQSAKTKTAKINLVAEWLGTGREFQLEGMAEELGKAYARKRKGERKVLVDQTRLYSRVDKLPKQQVEIGKLDDLADCMLQGMTWVHWEANRRMIMIKGIDALDELIHLQ